MTMSLHIAPDGTIRCLYGEEIDLAALGEVEIRRASRVEWNAGQWWVTFLDSPLSAIGLFGNGVLGPFGRKSEALAAEAEHLEDFLDKGPCPRSAIAAESGS
jgi:hypothetical protein